MLADSTDRYAVMGPPNKCTGECEGTGFIPIHGGDLFVGEESCRPVQQPDDNPIYRVLWALAEAIFPNRPNDAYHFIPCPDCRPHDRLVRLAKRFLRET